ncbi:MAG: YraN family protein [Minisyncoccia bacterium]
MKRIGKNKSNIGILGEDIATKWLNSKGFHILAQNFKTYHGELDIVAEKNGETYFVEVKTVKVSYGTVGSIKPEDNFTLSKSLKMGKAIELYLMRHSNIVGFKTVLLCVFIDQDSKKAQIKYLENPIF